MCGHPVAYGAFRCEWKTLAENLLTANQTICCAGALTVAGQRRSLTVFPNILAIAIIKSTRQSTAAKDHGMKFHDICILQLAGCGLSDA
jgi:hypothetical protein